MPTRDIYKTEQEFTAGWIALRFLNDPATALSTLRASASAANNPTALARAGYWQGRAVEATGPHAGRARGLRPRRRAIDELLRPVGARELGLPQIELNDVPRRARSRIVEVVRAVELLYALDERELAIPIFADMGEHGDADALAGLGELTARNGDARGMIAGSARARSIAACRSTTTPILSSAFRFQPIGPTSRRAWSSRSRGRKASSTRACLAGEGDGPDAGDAGRRTLRRKRAGAHLRSSSGCRPTRPTTRRSARPSSAACWRTTAAPTS